MFTGAARRKIARARSGSGTLVKNRASQLAAGSLARESTINHRAAFASRVFAWSLSRATHKFAIPKGEKKEGYKAAAACRSGDTRLHVVARCEYLVLAVSDREGT